MDSERFRRLGRAAAIVFVVAVVGAVAAGLVTVGQFRKTYAI